MKSINRSLKVAAKSSFVLAVLGLSGGVAFAAASASDTASNYAPSSWSNTPGNLGSGFGAWTISLANANNPPYVGTYLGTSGDGDLILTNGSSWATYANQGSPANGQITIARAFTTGGGSASLINQSFSFALASHGVGNNNYGNPGLLSAAVGTAFTFAYDGSGSDAMTLTVGGGTPITTPVTFNHLNAGLNVTLSVSGALGAGEGYTFTVSPFAGGSPLYTTSGTFDGGTYNTSDFIYVDKNTAGNGYLNNLNITTASVPEPSTLAITGLSGLAALLVIRRRRA